MRLLPLGSERSIPLLQTTWQTVVSPAKLGPARRQGSGSQPPLGIGYRHPFAYATRLGLSSRGRLLGNGGSARILYGFTGRLPLETQTCVSWPPEAGDS